MEAAMGRLAVIAGSHGRITLEGGAAPTKITIVENPNPDTYPGGKTNTARCFCCPQPCPPRLTLVTLPPLPAYHGLYVPVDETVITYALSDPGGLRPGAVREDLGGAPAPDFNYPNAHGFTYQAEAIHRCLAAGILQCPQFTAEDSLACMTVLDGIADALLARECSNGRLGLLPRL